MITIYWIALLMALLGLVLLLIQTARAAYWRGFAAKAEDQEDNLAEEVRSTRHERDRAIHAGLDLTNYIKRLHERSLLASSEPEMFQELMLANEMLRSVHAVVKREGADTNWEGLEERLRERLKAEHPMLYAADEGTR